MKKMMNVNKKIQMIKNLFDLEKYGGANKVLQSLIYRDNEFYPIIYKIIRKLIFSGYKNFIYHIKDKKIEKCNKLENTFQKKQCQIQKVDIQDNTGVLKRIYRRNLI